MFLNPQGKSVVSKAKLGQLEKLRPESCCLEARNMGGEQTKLTAVTVRLSL